MSFFRNIRGNVAIIFAVALVPILGLVAGAIDTSRHRSAENAAQVALDAALLNVAHEHQDMG